jgi:hypothetical protein
VPTQGDSCVWFLVRVCPAGEAPPPGKLLVLQLTKQLLGVLPCICLHDRQAIARAMYSNPPLHGALLVQHVFDDPDLQALWYKVPSLKPIGCAWSYLAYVIGHLVPILQPYIESSFQQWCSTSGGLDKVCRANCEGVTASRVPSVPSDAEENPCS